VRDLFFNTPARRKFMRSEATENFHLTSIVQHYALAHPETAFTLINNGREVLRVAQARDLRERAYQIFGGALIESLLPVAGGRDYVARISGFVSAPRERRTTRDFQYFFVNQRFVRDKIIAGGLLEGFRSVLPHGVYPVAFLFLEMPHEEIDVNVHPAKTEVRFRRSEAVKETIAEAIRDSLAKVGIVRETVESEVPAELPKQVVESDKFEQSTIDFHVYNDESSNVSVTETLHTGFQTEEKAGVLIETAVETAEQVLIQSTEAENELFSAVFEQKAADVATHDFKAADRNAGIRQNPSSFAEEQRRSEKFITREPPSEIVMPPVNSAVKVVKPAETNEFSASKIRPLGQLHNSYIIAVDDEGLLLVDQHVAHERILFDKYSKKETERRIESQNLLLPETIDLTPAQSQAFSAISVELERMGFGVMMLSGRTIAVKSVPTDLPPSEVKNLLAEILDARRNRRFSGL
jgi:DNA mismatch repair protein MutL